MPNFSDGDTDIKVLKKKKKIKKSSSLVVDMDLGNSEVAVVKGYTPRNLSRLSLKEIEGYGSEIQLNISDAMDKIIDRTRCIDLGKTGEYLSDLSQASDSITRKLAPSGFFKPVLGVKRWLTRFDTVESRIDTLDKGIEAEKVKLNLTLDGLVLSKDVLSKKLVELQNIESDLTVLVEDIKSGKIPDDGLKLQAAVNRLKVITTTIAVTNQEVNKTVLVIMENKEITAQLTEASQNLIPMFKTMMMNSLAIKTNAEAVKLKKAMISVGNKMVIENAKQISQTADDLIEGRTTSLISASTIEEANKILQDTITKVINSAKSETDVNLDLIESLKSSTEAVRSIKFLEDSEKK